jgi:hypothetical protein
MTTDPVVRGPTIARALLPIAALAALAASCISHNVESAPIEIKPIHITMDINLRVQRALDEFFDFDAPPPTEDKPKELP